MDSITIDALNNPVIKKILNSESVPHYRKKAVTLLRKPKDFEIGTELISCVKKGQGIRKESVSVIDKNSIIARSSDEPISKSGDDLIYNEWVIPYDIAVNNYSEEVIVNLTTEFSPHKKISTIKAVKITHEILNELGIQNDIVHIKVSWSNEPMSGRAGDYITDKGYIIAEDIMKDSYELLVK